jgi:hypothetical protein
LTGCLETGVFAINLKLDLGDARKYKCLRGVGTFRLGHKLLYRFGNGAYHNWMDIKLLNVPLKVQVTLAVDFREAMGASGHPHGPCPVYGCQVGLYGVQVRLSLYLCLLSGNTVIVNAADQSFTVYPNNARARARNRRRVLRIPRSRRKGRSRHI